MKKTLLMIASIIIGTLILTVGFSSAIAFAVEENTIHMDAEEVQGDDCNECQTNAQNIQDHATTYRVQNLDWQLGDRYYFGLLVDIITITFQGALEGYGIYGPIFGFNALDCYSYTSSGAIDGWNGAQTLPGKITGAILGAINGLLEYLIDLCDDIDGGMLPASAPGATGEVTMGATATSSTSSASTCGCEEEASASAASLPVVKESVRLALR